MKAQDVERKESKMVFIYALYCASLLIATVVFMQQTFQSLQFN